ncbi:Protein kinase superfamily protein [Raphanus sativus]|nr:Protein kinase superfamily protein [Raphanus sativus]
MQQSNEEFVKFLGEGTYGYVNLVRYTNPDDGSSFLSAVKNSYDEDYDSLRRELEILVQLRGSPRIVTCLGDSLQQGLSSYGNKVHKLQLEYASEDNLLVFPSSSRQDSSSYELKISDFGNSLEVGEVPLFWETDFPWVGTPIYMPPESVRDGVASKSLDLWSLGCLVREMYTGVIPWEGIELDDIATLLICGEAPWIPESLPSDAKAFIQTCFSSDPEDRGSAYELLFHPFLPRPEVQEEEKKTVDKTRSSFLLKLLKLRIRRTSFKKKSTTDALAVSEKKPLKLRFFPTKAQQFKRTLNKVLRLKSIPMKKWTDYNLIESIRTFALAQHLEVIQTVSRYKALG